MALLPLAVYAQPGSKPRVAEPAPPSAPAKDSTSKFSTADVMPEYPGGKDAMVRFISSHIRYPMQAMDEGIQGKVMVEFIVDEEGKVTDAKALQKIGGGCDEEAVRVVKSMPNWKPGMNKGVPVKAKFRLPVVFRLAEDGMEMRPVQVEKMPEYPGGNAQMQQYLASAIVYPRKALRAKTEGEVVIDVTITETGKVTLARLVQGIGHGCDEEAMRVVYTMPNWKPGQIKGRPAKAETVTIRVPFHPNLYDKKGLYKQY